MTNPDTSIENEPNHAALENKINTRVPYENQS